MRSDPLMTKYRAASYREWFKVDVLDDRFKVFVLPPCSTDFELGLGTLKVRPLSGLLWNNGRIYKVIDEFSTKVVPCVSDGGCELCTTSFCGFLCCLQ